MGRVNGKKISGMGMKGKSEEEGKKKKRDKQVGEGDDHYIRSASDQGRLVGHTSKKSEIKIAVILITVCVFVFGRLFEQRTKSVRIERMRSAPSLPLSALCSHAAIL